MLLICSYEDFKTREVDDKIWLIFSPIGIIITFIEYSLNYIDFSYLILYILSIIITAIVSIIIYYLKFVGGADSKALISISLFLFAYNLYRILNKENIFEGFENEKLYRKILMKKKRNLYFLY
jgi:preflagellin peptidase FlaK